jgi:hypothetical protein
MNNPAFRLSGDISDFPLPDIIQFLGMTRKTGELRLYNNQPEPWAALFFESESLLHACCEGVEGMEAFLRIITREKGQFHFFSDHHPEKQTIGKPVHYLMLQVQSQLDELRHLDKVLPKPETPLALNPAVDPIPRLNTQEWMILSRINGRRTLGQIIEQSDDELGSKKILHRLLGQRLITPATVADMLSPLVPSLMDASNTDSERAYPPRLRTNLLLKAIDGHKNLKQIGEQLGLKERDLIEDIKLLVDSGWIRFPTSGQEQFYLTLLEEL